MSKPNLSGDKLRQLRESRGWSQEELARRVRALGFKLTQQSVAIFENSDNPNPTFGTLRGIAAAFEIDLAEFVDLLLPEHDPNTATTTV